MKWMLVLVLLAGCVTAQASENPDAAALCPLLPALAEPWDKDALRDALQEVAAVTLSKNVGSHLLEPNLQNLFFSLGGVEGRLGQLALGHDTELVRDQLAKEEEGLREARAWLSETCG